MFQNVNVEEAEIAIHKRFGNLSKHPSKTELKVLEQHLDLAAIRWEKEIRHKLEALGPSLSLEFIDVYSPSKLKALAKQLDLEKQLYAIRYSVQLNKDHLQILNRGE